MERTLKLHNNLGHGWLEVTRDDLVTLGIAEQVSAFSCQDEEAVYLEEDRDKHVFLKAAKAEGRSIQTLDCYTSGDSFVRSLPSYQP